MRVKNIFYGGLAMTIIFLGCGIPQSDYDKLNNENKRLLTELDECKYGAERIAAQVEKAYKEKKYAIARHSIKMLYEKHPESHKNEKFKELLEKIKNEELTEIKRKEAKKKDSIRLANINNTGMWTVNYYVDDFGEPTKSGYITNTKRIRGTFSNTATQDSELDVRFLISERDDISIKLYEYAGNNPVKAYSTDDYTVLIQDKDGERLRLSAYIFDNSDRLSFYSRHSKKIHNALIKGGSIKFKIIEDDRPTTEYEFTLENANFYENAYKILTSNSIRKNKK